MAPSQHAITLRNGATLVLCMFESGQAPRGSVVIPSAMGVAQNYYARFAEWLASKGFLVATFDYRGIGLSAPSSLRGFKVDLLGWAQEDCAAVVTDSAFDPEVSGPGTPLESGASGPPGTR